jgi:hypothetical protein
MCGIVGYITTESHKNARERMEFLAQALIVDILRGKDSTGVMYGYGLQKGQNAGYAKDALDGFQFVKSAAFKDIVAKKNQVRFAVGHNRASTLGGISVDNAHPFKEDCEGQGNHCVIGLHNGTVRGNMHYLPLPKNKLGYEVDSHVIMANLAHVDPDDARKEVIEKLDGAYMLVWHDSRDGSLNFARNDTRSFHLAQSYEEDTLYFASEAGELQWLCDRNNLGIADVMSLKPGSHLKFTEADGLEPEVFDFEPGKKTWAAANNRKASNKPGTSGSTTTPDTTPTSEGGKTPGKSPARYQGSRDNQVLAGGRRRDVPQLLQEDLLELDLAVEDRILMDPMSVQKDSTAKRSTAPRFVSGYAKALDMTCVVHRVEPSAATGGFNRTWTVRPVAVRYMDEDPLLICELVATTSLQERFTLKDDDSTNSSTPSTGASPKVDLDGVEGPRGSRVSKAVFLQLTANGCVSCGKPIFFADHEKTRWDLITDEPQCKDCAKADDEALGRMMEDRGIN